jgi:hypothetical protein
MLGPRTMTDLPRYKPQIRASTSRRWPNWSTVPNPAAGTPLWIQALGGHHSTRACSQAQGLYALAGADDQGGCSSRWVRTRAADPRGCCGATAQAGEEG